MNKNTITTLIVIIAVIGIAWFVINRNTAEIPKDLAQCIGQNSEYYGQYGCPHCATQKEMFGPNFKYLNSVDCFYAREYCDEKNITATPTWIIQGQKYTGVQSKEKLMQLTGCPII